MLQVRIATKNRYKGVPTQKLLIIIGIDLIAISCRDRDEAAKRELQKAF